MAELGATLFTMVLFAGAILCPLAVAASSLGLFAALIAISTHQVKRRHSAWKALAAEQGWTYTADELRGTYDGRHVRVRLVTRKTGKNSYTYTVTEVAGLPTGVHLSKQGWLQFGRDDILGDPRFDEAFQIRVDTPQGLACLDAPTRATLRSARGLGLVLSKGMVVSDRMEVLSTGPAVLERVRQVVQLAELLPVAGSDPTDRLREMLRSDPVPAMRARAVGALLKLRLDAPEGRAALSDPEPLIAMEAALHLQQGAVLCRVALEPAHSRPVRIKALRHLADLGQVRACTEAVSGLCAQEDPLFWDHAARVCLQVQLPGAVRPLAELVGGHIDPAQWGDAGVYQAQRAAAKRVAIALGRHADPSATEALLVLMRANDNSVRTKAIASLGAVGTAAEVRHIAPYTDAGLPGSALRRTARKAIQAIQERVGGEVGQLSLARAGPQEGALSEARSGGELALARDQRAQRTPS